MVTVASGVIGPRNGPQPVYNTDATMRLVIDLQAAQCESKFRGIGRYSLSLAKAMIPEAVNRGHEVLLVLSDSFPETLPVMRQEFNGLLSEKNIIILSLPRPVAEMAPQNIWLTRAAEVCREYYLARLHPDIVHVASLFEGWLDDAVTSVHATSYNFNTAVTLYDLIPYMMRETYLADTGYQEYYLQKIASLRRADLLLAISEFSRIEAVRELKLNKSRVINISAAVDSTFRPMHYSKDTIHRIKTTYAITRPFVLCVPGGFDPRKNIDRLLEAYASLPLAIRRAHQLVIVSKMPPELEAALKWRASQLALDTSDLVLTNYIPDDVLVALYNICKLCVFPSLHEGFGLPALEAMACGAPVIGSNTSSTPEVVGWSSALFDPLSASAIAHHLARALSDPTFEERLRVNARTQASRFSWKRSAVLALNGIEDDCRRSQRSKLFARYPISNPDELLLIVTRELQKNQSDPEPLRRSVLELRESILRNAHIFSLGANR